MATERVDQLYGDIRLAHTHGAVECTQGRSVTHAVALAATSNPDLS